MSERCTSQIHDRFGSWWHCIAPASVEEHVICLSAGDYFWWRFVTAEALALLDGALEPYRVNAVPMTDPALSANDSVNTKGE